MKAALAVETDVALEIRPAVAADVPLVIALDEEVTGLAKPDYWQDTFERFGARQRGERFFLVAERQGRVEGFVIGEIRAWEFGSPPCGWIFAIQVRPKSRLKGVATQLFDAICDCFRKVGVVNIRTMAARDDITILSFFRSQGMMAGPFFELEATLE
ncbi:MAG: GNAT family N-acetyltransferase [Alphaproteobacteria bacterium]|nr:GNAT family N-acetyltransferase [Alphaproteobacteria bacterium]